MSLRSTVTMINTVGGLDAAFLGFPIIPQHHVRGMYEGHPYFVYERIAKTLMDVITNRSLHVSQDDLVNIAVQLFEILHFLIVDGKVLKNLTVNDFILRRTTKGYRLVLLNQDFYDGFLLILLLIVVPTAPLPTRPSPPSP